MFGDEKPFVKSILKVNNSVRRHTVNLFHLFNIENQRNNVPFVLCAKTKIPVTYCRTDSDIDQILRNFMNS